MASSPSGTGTPCRDPSTNRHTRPASAATGDEHARLVEAVAAIGSEVDTDVVLCRLLDAARLAIGARRSAIGMRDASGRWYALASAGLGDGDLERLSREVASHAAGEDGGLLVLPVRRGDESLATVFLTGERFTDADRRTADTLVTAASRAIGHAVLLAQARERVQLLAAVSDVVRALSSGAPRADVLDLVARWARTITGAQTAGVAVPDEDDLVVAAADGLDAQKVRGLRVPRAGTTSARVLRDGAPAEVANVSAPAARAGLDLPFGAGLVATMGQGEYFQGVVAVTNEADTEPVPAAKLAPLAAFAEQAGLALEVAGRRRNAERVVKLEERERIATGLHDVVIGRLFAVASTLSATAGIVSQREAVTRLRHAIAEIDATIARIRATIFE